MLLEWKLKKVRLTEQKNLNETNLYLYKSITTYIQNSDLRELEKEEVLQQIMDMILQAQAEDKSVNLVIGQDYEKFCQSIIEEYLSFKGKPYRVLNFMQRYFIDVILITSIMAILGGIINKSFDFGITIDQFIVANVISLVIIPVARKNMQETSSLTSLYHRLCMVNNRPGKAIIFMLVIMGLIRIILEKMYGPQFFNIAITLYSGIPYIIIMLIIIGAVEVYKRVYDRM